MSYPAYTCPNKVNASYIVRALTKICILPKCWSAVKAILSYLYKPYSQIALDRPVKMGLYSS